MLFIKKSLICKEKAGTVTKINRLGSTTGSRKKVNI